MPRQRSKAMTAGRTLASDQADYGAASCDAALDGKTLAQSVKVTVLIAVTINRFRRPFTLRAPMTSSVAAPGQSRVATVDEIRAHFPALERRHNGLPVAYFDGPGGTQVPRAVSRCGHRVPAAPQRQYPLAIPEQPRDRRDPGRRPRGARRPARRRSRRGGLRRQHDDADLPSRTWHSGAAGARATRSSSPSSITMQTSRPGGRWSASAA